MSAGTVTQPLATDPLGAMGNAKKLFIVGCPRSGTTWMQLLLAQHPSIATAPETQIFAYYLEPMRKQWAQEQAGAGRNGSAGLSRLLSDAEFEELCRTSAEFVLEKIRQRNPAAAVVAEKSPKHALQANFIQRLFPDAYFLHVVRDPRDAGASLLAASRAWGADWAPHNVVDAARMWRDHVLAARGAAANGRFLEVKYEALIGDAARELQAIHEWLDLPTDAESCEAAVAACDFSRLKEDSNTNKKDMPLPSSQSPKEFFRSGVAGSGLRDLPAAHVRILESICGPLMDELGYARAAKPGAGTRARIAMHDGLFRVRESFDWQLQRLLRKI